MRIKNLFLALFALPLFFVACEPDTPAVEVKEPTVTVVAGEVTTTTISFTITSTDADKVAYLVVEGTEAPTASEVLANGTEVEANKSVVVTATELKADTEYTIVAAAQNSQAVVKGTASKKTAVEGGDEPTPGPEPGPEPDADTFVATHIVTDYSNEDGMHIYVFELGDNTWGNNGWGVNGGTYYSFAIVSASKGNGVLPNGTYSLADSYTANTIIPDYSYRYQMEDSTLVNGFEMYKDANVVITNGKIEANIELERDGSIHKVVFEGDLAVEDGGSQKPAEFEATHVADKWYWGGPSSYGNKYSVAGDGFSVDVHLLASVAAESAIVAGEYAWVNTTVFGDYADEFTTRTLTVDGTLVPVDAGLLSVSNEGEEYHIEMTLEGRDGFVYMIEYNGKLNDKGEDVGMDGTALSVKTLSEGTYNSSYYFYTFKAAGDNFSFDLIINDYQARANMISAGTFQCAASASYAGNNNLFYTNNFKYDGISYKPSEVSTMEVVTEDMMNVQITLNLTMQTGDKFVVTYNGLVGGSANEGGSAELVKLATPTVVGMVAGNAATVSWNEIAGAKDYTVTLNGTESKTVSTAYIVYEGLAWETTYNVSVVANPADAAVNSKSDAGTATFTTEANPGGGNEGGDTGASYENWVFSATLDMGSLLVTLTDGSHTVTMTLNQLSGGIFYLNGDGVLNANNITVNGVPAESAYGTMEMSSSSSYYIVLDATINGVKYTGTSSNPVV